MVFIILKKEDVKMLKFLKKYFMVALSITVIIAMFGFILPYLFSMNSNEAVSIGYVFGILSIGLLLYLVYKLVSKGVNMFKKFLLIFFALSIIGFTACSKVPAGYVGIKVYMLGTSKGVDQEVLKIGRYWIGVNEELYLFPVFMQNVRWTESITDFSPADEAIRFQEKNTMTLTADVGFSYTLKEDIVPKLFQKHRKGMDEITQVYLRNIVQNAFNVIGGSMTYTDISENKGIFLQKIISLINESLKGEGFTIEKLNILDLRPPESLKNAIAEKMKAQQLAEQAKANAEATLTTARAEAEAIRLKTITVTPLMVKYEMIQKWNGVLPQVSGGAMPFINFNLDSEVHTKVAEKAVEK
jgi:regulator of protease activity HflC (stomatin/prohibitin superfamily)